MDILAWLLVGLIAGAVARLVMPGRDPLGVGGTLLLGLVGSVIGGFLAGVVSPGNDDFNVAGLLGSIIGAIVALAVYRALVGGPRRRRTV